MTIYTPPDNPAKGMSRRGDHHSSVVAAAKILPDVSKLQRLVLQVIRKTHSDNGGNGVTDRELEVLCRHIRRDDGRGYHENTFRRRRSELFYLGYLRKAGEFRDGLNVWVPVDETELAERLRRERDGTLF